MLTRCRLPLAVTLGFFVGWLVFGLPGTAAQPPTNPQTRFQLEQAYYQIALERLYMDLNTRSAHERIERTLDRIETTPERLAP